MRLQSIPERLVLPICQVFLLFRFCWRRDALLLVVDGSSVGSVRRDWAKGFDGDVGAFRVLAVEDVAKEERANCRTSGWTRSATPFLE